MIKTILLISVVSLSMIVGCLDDIPERQIEYYEGFVVDIDYLPETLFEFARTIITFSDRNVLVLRKVHGISQNQIVNITYYKERGDRGDLHRFVSVEMIK